jgi:hypothetical protein
MRKRSVCVGLIAAALLALVLPATDGLGQPKEPPKGDKKEPPPTSNQLLMRDKLTYAKDVLDGLSLENYGKVAASAELMRMISKAASWHVLDSDEYTQLSKNFQEQAADLERHAKEKNLDAASLDYMRISLTCIQCHKYVRGVRAKEKR